MKNLPDKIYLNLNMTPQEVVETKDKDFHEATKTWEITWSEDRQSEYDPEYVRKDAVIEDILKFLDENFFFSSKRLSIESGLYNSKKEMLEDFKEYMENE